MKHGRLWLIFQDPLPDVLFLKVYFHLVPNFESPRLLHHTMDRLPLMTADDQSCDKLGK